MGKIVIYDPKNREFLCDKNSCSWGGFGVEWWGEFGVDWCQDPSWDGRVDPDRCKYLPFGGEVTEEAVFENVDEAVKYATTILETWGAEKTLRVLEMENYIEQRVIDGTVIAEYPVMRLKVLEDVTISLKDCASPLELRVAELLLYKKHRIATLPMSSLVYLAREILEEIERLKQDNLATNE